MLVIVGESASGKTTLVNMLINANPGYHKVITYTTRPIREGEQNGVDYYFVSEDTFQEMIEKGKFVEHADYRGWHYGLPKEECIDDYAVAIVTPAGLRALKNQGFDIKSVYLYVDRRSRLINLLCRGDDIEEAYRRNLSDVGMFDGIEAEVDCIVENSKYHMDEHHVLMCLQEFLFGINKNNPDVYKQESLFEDAK